MDERKAHHSNGDYRSPSKRFHGLHPLKRFKLLQQEEEEGEHGRKRDANPSITTTTTFCLPAKKRIWALYQSPQFESPSPSPPKRQRRPSQSPISKNALFQRRSAFDSPPEREVNKEKGVVREDGSADNNEELEEEDDGIVCDVCKSTDGDPSDPIVLCDGCDVMVHASCYGDPLVRAIPEGDWFCAKCQSRNSCSKEPPTCCLCPADHGALKPTTDGRWAHILCALLVPEVFFRDSADREGIDCSNVPRRRWEGHCYVCDTNKGSVIECSEPRCSSAFHASCGLENDLHLEYKEERAGGLIVGFCKLHTHLWKKQQLTGKFKIVPRVQAKAKGRQR